MFPQIKRVKDLFLNNKDSRILISNFGYLSILQIAGYIFPLITIPYLARTVGAYGFGKIAFASAVNTWFLSVVTWGFDYTATREVARNRNNKERVSEVFSNVIWTRFFLTLICFSILSLLTFIIPDFRDNRGVLFVTFLMIPGHVLFPEWMFQALERMKYITLLSLLSKFVFTLAVFVFIHKPSDYILQPLFTSIGFVVSGIVSLYLILYRWGYRLLPPSFTIIRKTIKGSADVFINNFTPNLYNSMSVVLLGAFHGSVSTGILSSGQKCLDIVKQFMNVLSRTFFPYLSRRLDKHTLYARISVTIAASATLLLIILAPTFIKLFYTEEFNDGIFLSIILAPSLLFLTISDVYGTNYLILKGYEHQLRNISMVCSIIGFTIAFPLVYFLDYYGAATTIVFTRFILSMSTYFFARKVKQLNKLTN